MSLQVLRRKSDLYLSDHLDIKAVFYCGECHFSKFIINAQHLFIYLSINCLCLCRNLVIQIPWNSNTESNLSTVCKYSTTHLPCSKFIFKESCSGTYSPNASACTLINSFFIISTCNISDPAPQKLECSIY